MVLWGEHIKSSILMVLFWGTVERTDTSSIEKQCAAGEKKEDEGGQQYQEGQEEQLEVTYLLMERS
jgi:hypothetical protein